MVLPSVFSGVCVCSDINFYFLCLRCDICVLCHILDNTSVNGATAACKTSSAFCVASSSDPASFSKLGITPQILPPDAAVDVASLIRVPNSNPAFVRVDSNSVVMFASAAVNWGFPQLMLKGLLSLLEDLILVVLVSQLSVTD